VGPLELLPLVGQTLVLASFIGADLPLVVSHVFVCSDRPLVGAVIVFAWMPLYKSRYYSRRDREVDMRIGLFWDWSITPQTAAVLYWWLYLARFWLRAEMAVA
jgi:hypothetical protein